jgi:hypothetical protein
LCWIWGRDGRTLTLQRQNKRHQHSERAFDGAALVWRREASASSINQHLREYRMALSAIKTTLAGAQAPWPFVLAVIAAAMVLAGAVLISNRWEISAVASEAGSGVYILDHWTGQTKACVPRAPYPWETPPPTEPHQSGKIDAEDKVMWKCDEVHS